MRQRAATPPADLGPGKRFTRQHADDAHQKRKPEGKKPLSSRKIGALLAISHRHIRAAIDEAPATRASITRLPLSSTMIERAAENGDTDTFLVIGKTFRRDESDACCRVACSELVKVTYRVQVGTEVIAVVRRQNRPEPFVSFRH